MGSWSKALLSSTPDLLPSFPSSSTPHLSFLTNSSSSFTRHSLSFPFKNSTVITLKNSSTYTLTSENPTPLLLSFSSTKFICKAAEYKFPDPIPEFADAVSSLFFLLLIYAFNILVWIMRWRKIHLVFFFFLWGSGNG